MPNPTDRPRPAAYDHRVRLAEHIERARQILAADPAAPGERISWAARCGQLEAMLKMIADSAEGVLEASQLDNSTEDPAGGGR